MSRPKTFTPSESCCRFLCSLVTWQRLSTTTMGYPLPSKRPEANLSENQRMQTARCCFSSPAWFITALQRGSVQCHPKRGHKNTAWDICEVFEKAVAAQFGISWPHVLNQWRSGSTVSCPPDEPVCPANRDPNSPAFPWNCTAWMLPLSAYHLRWNKTWQKKKDKLQSFAPALCKYDLRIPCSLCLLFTMGPVS